MPDYQRAVVTEYIMENEDLVQSYVAQDLLRRGALASQVVIDLSDHAATLFDNLFALVSVLLVLELELGSEKSLR